MTELLELRKDGVSKRRFIGLASAALVAGLSLLAATPPKIGSDGKKDGYLFYPGSIEAQTKSSFISLNGVHQWIEDVVLNNQILKETTSATLIFHNESRRLDHTLSLVDIFGFPNRYAYRMLINLDPEEVAPKTNLRLEATHIGLIALTAALDPEWEIDRWHSLGGEGSSAKDDLQGENGLNKKVFPAILSSGSTTDLENHLRHLASFAMIAFVRGYAKYYGLAEYRTIPLGAQLLAEAVKPFYDSDDYEIEALAVASFIGHAYELKSTFNSHSIPFIQTPDQGLFDPNLKGDFEVNKKGAQLGARSLKRALAGQSLLPLIRELSSPKFQIYDKEAIFETGSPSYTRRSFFRAFSRG